MIWQKRQRQRHFENTFKGCSLRLVTFETFDQSDEETWHDQQRQRHSENTTTNTYEIEVWNCCHFRQLRTWVHDNHCYLGIKSDTGQHSQFLRCLSSPRASSARAVTGRRCPHRGMGEDFLARRPGSPHENGRNSETKSRKGEKNWITSQKKWILVQKTSFLAL